jgi:hypothetical protein
MAGLGDILGGPAAWAFPGVRKDINSFGRGMRDFAIGTPEKMQQTSTVTPEQQSALSQLLSHAMTGLQGNKFDFAPIEAQARQGFQQKTLPGIAELFSGMGSGGGQRSSAFAGSLGQAGAGLETGLAGMKQQYGQQQQNQLMQMLQMALQPQFENQFRPAQQGFLGNMAGGIGQGAGQGIGQLLPLLMML